MKRVGTGGEAELRIAYDDIIASRGVQGKVSANLYDVTLYELLSAYGEHKSRGGDAVLHIAPTELHAVEDAIKRLEAMVGRMVDNKLSMQATGSSPVWNRLIEQANVAAGFDLQLQTDLKLPVSAGALVISEFMTNPKVVANDAGEWLEFYNPGETPIDVNGWVLRDDSNPPKDKVVLNSTTALRVMPKGYLVVGNAADKAVNGGYTPAYAYDTTLFSLANGTDQDRKSTRLNSSH